MIEVDKLIMFFYKLARAYIFVSSFAVISIIFSIKKNVDQMEFRRIVRAFFKIDSSLILLILFCGFTILTFMLIKSVLVLDSEQILQNLDAELGFMVSPLIFGSVAWYLFCEKLSQILYSKIKEN